MFGNLTIRNRTAVLAIALTLFAPAFAGCVAGDGEGTAAFYVKDAPSDEFSHVNVTFSEVQIHQAAGNASDNDTSEDGWITVFSGTKTVDLLSFQGEDSKAFLGDANLSEGRYTQIRVTVDDAVGIDKDDGSEVDITVSSGTVKVVKPWDVTAGEATSITLDLDLDRSLRQQGNGQWRMTPVIGNVIVEDGPGPLSDQPDEAGGNQTDQANPGQTGQAAMTTYIKDAPTDEFREIWIQFDEVQVHFAGNGSDEADQNDSEEGENDSEGNATFEDDEGNTSSGNDTSLNESAGNASVGNNTAGNGSAGNDSAGNESDVEATGGHDDAPGRQNKAKSSDAGNDTEEDGDAGDGRWITTVNESRELDLLRFNSSDAKAFLGEATVPTGKYTQIRVNITKAWGVLNDNSTVNITVSSGTAKVVRPFEVAENGTTTQVVIDLNLDRSLREQGTGEWRMTPVIGSVAVNHVDEDPRADKADPGQQAAGQGQDAAQGNQTAGNQTAGNQTAGNETGDMGQGNQTAGQGQNASGQGQNNSAQADA